MKTSVFVLAGSLTALWSAAAWALPAPIGPATTTIRYQTAAGEVVHSGQRDFSGVGPGSAIPLGGAANIRTFNSANSFGRRTVVDNLYPQAIGANEALLTTAFFKVDNDVEFFPGLLPGSDLTIEATGIQLSEPASVDVSTFLFHTFWDADQVDLLGARFYEHVHNHHTATEPFRDEQLFLDADVFHEAHHDGAMNTAHETVSPVISGDGFHQPLSVVLTIPYELLKNLEQTDQPVPPGVPGPQGFLEPFHFHIEYVVVPEPGVLALLTCGSLVFLLRARKAIRKT